MTSEPLNAFVWIWLPGAVEPVVAGRLDVAGAIVTFTYGRSYLAGGDAMPLYLPELPLERGPISPLVGEIAGCIADAGPDAWGQRVILNRTVGADTEDTTALTPLTYLLESGSDRIGALDFQASSSEYVPRYGGEPRRSELPELAESALKVEEGIPLSPELDEALLHGSSVGGARPKVLLSDGDRHLIAKFSSVSDTYPVEKGEFVAMELARRAGLDVAGVEITRSLGKDVLLVERFDRPESGGRRAIVSALTILGLDEWSYGLMSYADLADQVRRRFTAPRQTLHELFARIAFNILVGNTDDHARNHAAFWDGEGLTLTPAYDICPSPRGGGEVKQSMAIGRDGYRFSRLAGCVERASTYQLSEVEARQIIDRQIEVIGGEWEDVCAAAMLSEVDRKAFWNRQFLNPYAFEGY